MFTNSNNNPPTRLRRRNGRDLSKSITRFNQLMRNTPTKVYQPPAEDVALAPQGDEFDQLADLFGKL